MNGEDIKGAEDVRRIEIKEFREFGYLHEVNRRFLHPLGLALEVIIDDMTGQESLGGVWDFRDDPEGICFGDGEFDREKLERVRAEWVRRHDARVAALGFMVQGT